MKTAPALAYPTGVPGAEGRLLALLALAWLAAQMLWLHAHHGLVHAMPAAWWASWWLGCVLLAWSLWRLRALVQGELVWEPRSEPAHATASPGSWRLFTPAWRRGLPLDRVACVIDLNVLMLLRLRSTTGLVVWAWCQRQAEPTRWLALRRAVYAHQATGEPGTCPDDRA